MQVNIYVTRVGRKRKDRLDADSSGKTYRMKSLIRLKCQMKHISDLSKSVGE